MFDTKFFLIVFLFLCSCARRDNKDAQENDPLESFNRVVFTINRFLDMTIFKPVAAVYDKTLPKPVKKCVKNFTSNLKDPLRAINFALQGQGQKMGESVGRFVINTTMGVGGLTDPAHSFGLKCTKTDFGKTLGAWGVEKGPYLMLPILGPTTFRGAFGYAGDYFMDPLYIYATNKKRYRNRSSQEMHWLWAFKGAGLLNERAEMLSTTEDIENSFSLDLYAGLRSLYMQKYAK